MCDVMKNGGFIVDSLESVKCSLFESISVDVLVCGDTLKREMTPLLPWPLGEYMETLRNGCHKLHREESLCVCWCAESLQRLLHLKLKWRLWTGLFGSALSFKAKVSATFTSAASPQDDSYMLRFIAASLQMGSCCSLFNFVAVLYLFLDCLYLFWSFCVS